MTSDLHEHLQAKLGDAYVIEHELGGGGMSRVFVATETAFGRKVVVKVLPPEMAATVSMERFKREIAVAARLQHPHIVPLHSAGDMYGIPYYTMPLVEGESLRARLARRGELPVSESVRVLRAIASGLAYAHERGVVHRDIKPDNVLLSGDVAMVTDFGVAKALSESSDAIGGPTSAGLTSVGVALGTPAYMAPEQASADPTIDHRADVYALGVVAYEMLTGRPPFEGRNAVLLTAHVMASPEPISHQRPNLPPALAALVMQCLEKAPADRPQSAAEIVRALDDLATPSAVVTPASAVQLATGASSANVAPLATNAQVAPDAPSATSAAGSNTRPATNAPADQRPRANTSVASRRLRTTAVIVAAVIALGAVGVILWTRDRTTSPVSRASDGRDRRIAVLPFENLGDSADAYFADGITDAVRGKLTGLSAIEVIARGSSLEYGATARKPAEIARELGVRYLLTGTVRWAKRPDGTSHVQVSPELVEVRDDGAAASRWQEPFDAQLSDVFKVQGEIAGRVVERMRVALGVADQAQLQTVEVVDQAAYDLFLRGEAAWNGGASGDPASVRRAVSYFERTVARDSTMVRGWAKLARGYTILYINGTPTPTLARQAREAAHRTQALDPNGGAGHRAMGMYLAGVEGDNMRALAEFDAASRIAPGDPSARGNAAAIKESLGRYEAALEDHQAARRLDPRSPIYAHGEARTLLALRRYPEARAAADRARALAPTNIEAIETRAMIELASGDLAQARQVLATAERDQPAARIAAFLASYWDLGWSLGEESQRILLSLGPEAFDDDRAIWGIVRAQQYFWRGDAVQGRVWADTARIYLEQQMRELPDDAQVAAFYGLSMAYLGHPAQAIASAKRAVALIPVSSDAILGSYFEHLLARTYLLVGEQGRALELLEGLLARPYFLSAKWLRIDPTFAVLLGNPRFEKLTGAG